MPRCGSPGGLEAQTPSEIDRHPRYMRKMAARPYGRFKGLAMVAVAIVAASACSSATSTPTATTGPAGSANPNSSASTVSHKPVTISVGVLRPGATQEATDALNLQISEFEAKYPWVTVEPQEYNWTAPTFTAALAAGTLPDVFTIPFTDGKGLIQQHQIVNIDSRVRALPYIDKFNKSILANGQDEKGAIWAVPYTAYGMSLTYNRTMFTQAGLDPNKPPTTWDEVRSEEHTSELQSRQYLVCRLLLEKRQ